MPKISILLRQSKSDLLFKKYLSTQLTIVSYVPLPTVYEREGRTERAWDIYSRLLRDRIIFIGTPINDFVANAVVAQMLFLQMEDPEEGYQPLY